MGKRSCLSWIVKSAMSLFVLTQSAHADLMKIDSDFSIGLSIPINEWAAEYGTMEYWLTVEAKYRHGTPDTFEYSTLSQTFAMDKESLVLSFNILMEIMGGDTDVFTSSLDRTILYTPITDFGDNSFRGTAWVPSYDPSNMVGKKSVIDTDLWH